MNEQELVECFKQEVVEASKALLTLIDDEDDVTQYQYTKEQAKAMSETLYAILHQAELGTLTLVLYDDDLNPYDAFGTPFRYIEWLDAMRKN